MNIALSFVSVLVLSVSAVAQESPAATEAPAQPSTRSGGGTSEWNLFRTKGNAFNPDISANLLGLYRRGTALTNSRTDPNRNGFSLQEAELQFTADVDPYFRAVGLFAVGQEDGTTEFAIEPEEVFAETISLPWVTLKAGKFRTAFGKHNTLHTHAYPFIDAPLFQQRIFGDEGLSEVGASASALIPVSWFSEITLQTFSLSNETFFNEPNSGRVAGLARIRNLIDLSDSTTLEAGVSGLTGKNQFSLTSKAYGADVTLKWRPTVGGKYHALVWTTEYVQADRAGFTDATTGGPTASLGGVASWVQYQFAQRWWLQARGEYLGIRRESATLPERKQSALLGFFPSEFTGLRIQYDHLKNTGRDRDDHAISFQYNVSIGAHPAHAY